MTERTILSVPDFCLILLIGPAGSGQSTFARRHFTASEIMSLEKGPVGDDETDLSSAPDAVAAVAAQRLARRRLAVIDATNMRREDRARFIALAKKHHALPVAFVFLTPGESCDRRLKNLEKEGIRQLHAFRDPRGTDEIERVVRQPLPSDMRHEVGPFDIIGDVHGCADELETLLEALGYRVDTLGAPGGRSYQITPPEGRRSIFVGDLVDRGPRTPDVLRLVKGMVDARTAFCVIGNHDDKLLRKLRGNKVKVAHGLEHTLDQFERQPQGFPEEMRGFLDSLVSHYVLEGGALVVAHAGLTEDLQNRTSRKVRSFALYGDTSGEIDAFGVPVRADWAARYRGSAKVVYGHAPTLETGWVNGTICIDTGCVFGGKLTALRWPEMELVGVPAAQVWYEPKN